MFKVLENSPQIIQHRLGSEGALGVFQGTQKKNGESMFGFSHRVQGSPQPPPAFGLE